MSKVYISGPMSGYPEYNRVAFEEAANWLRDCGHEVVSPIEVDKDGGFDLSGPLTEDKYWEFLGRDVQLVGQGKFDALILLDGWWRSRGARLEVFQAMLLKIPVYNFRQKYPLALYHVMHVLTDSIVEE